MLQTWPKRTADGFPYWEKTPAEFKDYTFVWDKEIGTASISTSTWTIRQAGADMVKEDDSVDDVSKKTNVVISGGIDGTDYEIINKITVGALIYEKKLLIKVRAI